MDETREGAVTRKPSWRFSVRSALLFIAACCVLFAVGHYVVALLADRKTTALRHQCQGNLSRIGDALRAYRSAHGSYPPAYIADANGKPLHSWRVLILPELGQRELYQKLHLDEPWDSPHNAQFAAQIVEVYHCPANRENASLGVTDYVAVVGAECDWPRIQELRSSNVSGGKQDTFIVVEANDASIGWMEPRDFEFSKMSRDVAASKTNGVSGSHLQRALFVNQGGRVIWSGENIVQNMLLGRDDATSRNGDQVE